mgnify:CR=1 FL=1
MALTDAKGIRVPGVSPAAMQMGRFVGETIARRVRTQPCTTTGAPIGTAPASSTSSHPSGAQWPAAPMAVKPNSAQTRPNAKRSPRLAALSPRASTRPISPAVPKSSMPVRPISSPPNIAPGSADVVRPWVEALRNVGFAVFAKPKVDEDSDVDSDMLDHIALRRGEGLAAVLVASADGQAFRQPLEEIARDDGTPVTVLGFREHASWALASDSLEFVDLEDIPGVFREPLPRIGLDSLPEQGAWLQPFRPLSSLLMSRT